MSLVKILDQLEEKYYDELEEDRTKVIPELIKIHHLALENGDEAWDQFREEVMERFGGIYIPYIFWKDLAEFMDDNETRPKLFATIRAFTESGFEDIEKKKMKPLLLTYFSMEKEFEMNKLLTLVVEKAHPSVQEYFSKLRRFVEGNSTSVTMYIEKFDMLKNREPDFDLMKMPVMKLRERLAGASA